MRVLVTGATGFIGSHTAAALTVAGHEVRVLARIPARVPLALDPLGVAPEVAEGDMTDERAVARAVDGCDAVIHAAAAVGVGGGERAGDANLAGTRTVIGAALDAGVRHAVYTSSVSVHMPCAEATITLDSPLAEPFSTYSTSKVAAEKLVQGWQDDGHPVTTVVLGGVYGPQALDHFNSFKAITSAAGTMMLVPPGGTSVIDVRDVAQLLTRIVSDGGEPVPRVLAGGHFVSWEEWVATLERALGRTIVSQPITADELLALARELTAATAEGEEPLLTEESAKVMIYGVPSDDRASLNRFDMTLRPLQDTFTDTVEYLRTTGQLPSPPESR